MPRAKDRAREPSISQIPKEPPQLIQERDADREHGQSREGERAQSDCRCQQKRQQWQTNRPPMPVMNDDLVGLHARGPLHRAPTLLVGGAYIEGAVRQRLREHEVIRFVARERGRRSSDVRDEEHDDHCRGDDERNAQARCPRRAAVGAAFSADEHARAPDVAPAQYVIRGGRRRARSSRVHSTLSLGAAGKRTGKTRSRGRLREHLNAIGQVLEDQPRRG